MIPKFGMIPKLFIIHTDSFAKNSYIEKSYTEVNCHEIPMRIIMSDKDID